MEDDKAEDATRNAESADSSEEWTNMEYNLHALIDRCRVVSAELRNGVRVVARSVRSEIKWGGLIFNPDDIMKALGKLNEKMGEAGEEGLAINTELLSISTTLPSLSISPIELDRTAVLFSEIAELISNIGQQLEAVNDFIDRFYVALCNAGSARQLLPYFMEFDFAWEKDEDPANTSRSDSDSSRAEEEHQPGLLDRLFGRR